MKKNHQSLLAAVLFIASIGLYAQQSVSIGTTATDPAAVLLLVGDNQGLIIPKATSISGMPLKEGMLVYSITDKKVFYSDGATWAALGGGTTATAPVLNINGNQISIFSGANVNLSGTAPSTVGQLFMWDGSKWTSTLATVPTTNQVLQWNGTTWAPATLPTGPAATFSNLTTTTSGLTVTGGTAAVAGAGTTINVQNATASQPGLLTVADFTTFNNKLSGNILTTSGDIFFHNGTATGRLAKGANGQALLSTATGLQWSNLPGGGDMLKSTYDTNSDGIVDVAATVNFGSQGANTVLASPNGAAGVATFRTLVGADLPNLDIGKLTSGTLGVARGGTGLGTVPTLGQLLIGNGTGYGLGSLTAGAGITVTPAAGGITIASTGLANPMTAQGDIIVGGAAGAPTRLAGTAGFLKSTGAAAPTWSALVASDIPNLDAAKITTGTLPVAQGGTGATTLSGVLVGNGTSPLTGLAAGVGNQYFRRNAGNTAYEFANLSITGADITDGTIANVDISDVDAGKITTGILPVARGGTGRDTWDGLLLGSGGTLADISNGTDGQVLRIAGTTPSWQALPSQFSTLNTIPKGDGIAGMIASQIFDDGFNVGIGTTAPDRGLQIELPPSQNGIHLSNSSNLSNGFELLLADAGNNNNAYVWNWENSNIYFGTNNTYRMTLDPLGNVGIGTTAPVRTLDIVTPAGSSYGVSHNDGTIRMSSYIGTLSGGGVGGSIGTESNHPFFIYVANSGEKATFLPNGNVGIGTSAPAFKLDVNGHVGVNGNVYFPAAGANQYIFGLNSYFGVTNHWIPNFSNALDLGTSVFRWRTVYTNSVVNVSDRRLKKDIKPIKYGLSEILKLKPVSYVLKDDLDMEVKLGLIAQEVQKLVPEVISEDESEEKILGMSYTELVPVLIKAAQELSRKIEILEKENQELKAGYANLQSEVSQIKGQQSTEIAALKKQMDEVKKLLGMEAKKGN